MRTRTHAGAGVDGRRVEHHHVPLALRCAAAVDDTDGPTGERLGELTRVADGGGAADDARAGAVVGADAQQAAQHVGDVAAEDAPVGVRLVDDDEAQLLEELEPLGVVGQDRRAQHVRVGDHDLAGLAHHGADGRRRVPVVHRGREVHLGQGGQVAELGQLVLAQGLGGEQVERPSGRVVGDRLQDRQVVAERLARCGGRDDGDVLAVVQRIERLALVAVERGDAATLEGPHQAPVEPVGHVAATGGRAGRTRRAASAAATSGSARKRSSASRVACG